LNERFAVARKPYNDFINKELQIEIHADKGRPPQVLITRIQDIINAAKRDQRVLGMQHSHSTFNMLILHNAIMINLILFRPLPYLYYAKGRLQIHHCK
jgi:hypothetical protein